MVLTGLFSRYTTLYGQLVESLPEQVTLTSSHSTGMGCWCRRHMNAVNSMPLALMHRRTWIYDFSSSVWTAIWRTLAACNSDMTLQ